MISNLEYDLIPISKLEAHSLHDLAALHCQVMQTLLTDLGAPLVLRYYQCAQTEPSVIGLCAVSKTGLIDGWAIGSPAPSVLNARLRQPFRWFADQMLHLAATRPGLLIDLLRSFIAPSDVNRLNPGQIELTYIGVAPRAQGRGLAKILLGSFRQATYRAGYSSIVLSVETNNPAAIGLYTRSGFKTTRTFREGRFERQRMECKLN